MAAASAVFRRGLRHRLSAAARVPCGDPPSPVLDCARRGKRRPGSAHCTWREGLAESLDLPESSFGTVVTSLLPHHLPEELRAAAAAYVHGCAALRCVRAARTRW